MSNENSVLVVKNLNRWFKEKWVDVSRKDKDGKHPPCGRGKAKKGSKGYPKCRPSVRVSSKTPKTSGEMTSGQKQAATKRKRAKKQGVGGKPTIVKSVLVKAPPMALALRLLKGDCPTPSKGKYSNQAAAQRAADYQSQQSGQRISVYRCQQVGGGGCGFWHLTSG